MSGELNGDCNAYQLNSPIDQLKKTIVTLSPREILSQAGGTPSFDTLRQSPELVPPQILPNNDTLEEKSIDEEARVRLKQILGSLLNRKNNEKTWLNFEDFQEKQEEIEEDPTPDFLEGVFLVPTRDWTSIIRCRKWQPGVKICVYDARSFYLFDHKTWLRQRIVSFTESNEFQNFTILVILLGTLTLIIYDYQDRSSATPFNRNLDQINTYSTYFYLFEFAMKLVTQGVLKHPNSYFRDTWNWLDFLVVIAGVSELTNLPNVPVKALRAFRVLRPLRSIRQFPRLRKLIQGLTSSIPPLLNAMFFMLFVFVQFSIFGSQQFGSAYYTRCRLPNNIQDGVWAIDTTQPRLCSKDSTGYQCANGAICGEPSDVGLDFRNDKQYVQMSVGDYGITSFVNPFIGVLTIFQCITLEGWSTIMFNFRDNQNDTIVVPFFVVIVVVGSFFLINLVLAVIGQSLDQTEGDELEQNNKSKQSLAFSLLRKAKNLSAEEKQQFLAKITHQISNDPQSGLTPQNGDASNASTKIQISAVLPIESSFPLNQLVQTGGNPEVSNLRNERLNDDNQVQAAQTQVEPVEKSENQSIDESIEIQSKSDGIPIRATTNKLYFFCYKLCQDPTFQITFTLIIVANALTMTLDRFPQPKKRVSALDTFNQVCSWMFTVEMIIKLLGIGIVEYARDRFNLFDSFIVVMSLIENITYYVSGSKIGSGIIVLRSFRLLRIFKLARSWTSFRMLISKIIETLPNVLSFGFLQLIFLSVFIILGMQFFAGTVYLDQNDKLVSDGTPPLQNFETVYNATVSVLGIMMIDGWNNTMFQYCRGLGVIAQIYFIAAILVLNIILLNLFLAIILENFGVVEDSEDDGKDPEAKGFKNLQIKLGRFLKNLSHRIPCFGNKLNTVLVYLESTETSARSDAEFQRQPTSLQLQSLDASRCGDNADELVRERRKLLSVAQTVRNATTVEVVKNKLKKRTKLYGKSLSCLTAQNPLRRFCAWIFDLKHFDSFSNVMVLFSTVLLAIDNPLDDPKSRKQVLLTILDYCTTAIFSTEAIIKIVIFGLLLNGKLSYLRVPWNILDCLVVLVSLFSYLPLGTDLQFYKSMRLLRILRPLRMIQRNQGLKLAIKSLVNVVPAVINLLFISVINLGLLAVLGLNIFKGTFYSCDMDNIPIDRQTQVKNMWDCQDYGGQWTNANQNFDNFIDAYYTVYQISTTDNWLGIATLAQQKTEIFQMPTSMSSPITIVYFVIVLLLQSLFMVNLFVGVVIATYEKEKEKLSNNTQLTALELEYIDTCIKCYKVSPQKVFTSSNVFRRVCYSITEQKVFKGFMFGCILANTVMLGCTWYGMSAATNTHIDYVNISLICVYSLEVALKFCAHGKSYFQEGWNVLDFVIVVVGVIGYVMQYVSGTNYTLSLTVIRAFKVSSLLKMIRQLK